MKPLSSSVRADLLKRASREANHAPGVAAGSYALVGGLNVTSSGLVVVPVQQLNAGIPVLNGVRAVRFGPDGDLVKITGSMVPVDERAPVEATVGAADAVRALLAHFMAEDLLAHDLTFSAGPADVVAEPSSPSRITVLRRSPFHDVLLAELVLDASAGRGRLLWEIRFALELDGWVAWVDAAGRGTPRVRSLRSTASHAAQAFVHLRDPRDGCAERELPMPRSQYPPFGGGSLETGAWVDGSATSGNNALAHDVHNELVQGTTADGDLTFQPADALGVEQGIVNAFYLCNFLHDFYLLLGFDEAAGNFQVRNEAGVGLGGDPMDITVRDSRQRRWAFYDHRPDGTSPRLSFSRHPAGNLSALDAHVVIHEFTHGVLDRIIGTKDLPLPLRFEESEALGEGLCDYFAITLVNRYGSPDGSKRWTFADWATMGGDPIRAESYEDYPHTYGHLHTPKLTTHDGGQVWCAALLDVSAIVGDELAWRITFDAIQLLHPGEAGPTFVHARDAVVDAMDALADSVAELDAATRREVRDAFSKRGLGGAAASPEAKFKSVVESTAPID